MLGGGNLRSRSGRVLLVPLVAVLLVAITGAQTRYTFSSGQTLSPAYEGWWPNEDGSFTLFFGYMNTNWQQEFDIPVGPANAIEPGGPDQGQPTHFYPRRNPFLFTIKVPKDFGKKELIWTLTANGKTEHAYASLKSDYQIDKQVISTEVGGDGGSLRDELRSNIPPEVRIDGEKRRTAKVGQPLTLGAFANDPDNLPARRGGRGGAPGAGRGAQPAAGRSETGAAATAAPVPRPAVPPPSSPPAVAPRPPSAVVASSGPGLRLSWIVYRGKASTVAISPDQMKTWNDTRMYANSPWSPPYVIPEPPPDGKFVAQVTFQEPGTYVMRALASDGSLFTSEDVTVTVTP